MTRRTWVQKPGGLVEVFREGPQASTGPSIRAIVEPFLSPIDGTIISNRQDLDRHNKRHGVSNDLDSLKEKTQRYMASRGKEAPGTKQERIATLIESYDRASSPDFNRRKQYHEDSQLQ